ncbi:unnamed protein product, partial [Scytosiphon promiscuus]
MLLGKTTCWNIWGYRRQKEGLFRRPRRVLYCQRVDGRRTGRAPVVARYGSTQHLHVHVLPSRPSPSTRQPVDATSCRVANRPKLSCIRRAPEFSLVTQRSLHPSHPSA